MGSFFIQPFAAVQESYRKREAQRLKKKNDKAKVREWLACTAQHRHEQWVDEELEPYLLAGTLHLVDSDSSTDREENPKSPTSLDSPTECGDAVKERQAGIGKFFG
ncbi:hypothetical protein TWF694_007162 [Orbilia ellipsospora]|uniref:Uncharacterized protein n=1 Tax=Orbilia ellipsospora TaxID=2528407 RepID=A0AAV9XHE5_9PEZI